MGSLTVQWDLRIPALYVYLQDPTHFRAARSKKVGEGVVIDFDTRGRPIGVEMLGKGSLDVVLKQIVQKYHVPQLRQLESRRDLLRRLLAESPA